GRTSGARRLNRRRTLRPAARVRLYRMRDRHRTPLDALSIAPGASDHSRNNAASSNRCPLDSGQPAVTGTSTRRRSEELVANGPHPQLSARRIYVDRLCILSFPVLPKPCNKAGPRSSAATKDTHGDHSGDPTERQAGQERANQHGRTGTSGHQKVPSAPLARI